MTVLSNISTFKELSAVLTKNNLHSFTILPHFQSCRNELIDYCGKFTGDKSTSRYQSNLVNSKFAEHSESFTRC